MKMTMVPCLVAVLFVPTCLFGQATTTTTTPHDSLRNLGNQASRLDDVTSGSNIRVSKLMGMNIYNSAGESVGEVQDIVLDGKQGAVRYVAVTYGGFLGLGNELFAVPFEAFACNSDPNNSSSHRLVLNVTKEQMAGAKGFDQNHWPNFSDRDFVAELDQRYRIDRNDGVRGNKQ